MTDKQAEKPPQRRYVNDPRRRWAAAFVLAVCIVWLALGFMAWQWDPQAWQPAGRGLALGLALLLAGVIERGLA